MPLPEVKGNLVDLRPLRRSDVASIQRHANNRRVSRYLPLVCFPYTLKDAQNWVSVSLRLTRTGQGYHFGVVDKQSNKVVGCMGLKNINCHDRNAEVGYWLGEKLWGRGYMSEALGLITGFAFNELRLRRIYAIVHASNVGSIKVLERIGFKHEGTCRKASLMRGRWTDVYFYGLLKEEFRR